MYTIMKNSVYAKQKILFNQSLTGNKEMAAAHADPWASMHAREHESNRAASCHACRGPTWPPTVKTRIHQGAPSLLIVPF